MEDKEFLKALFTDIAAISEYYLKEENEHGFFYLGMLLGRLHTMIAQQSKEEKNLSENEK